MRVLANENLPGEVIGALREGMILSGFVQKLLGAKTGQFSSEPKSRNVSSSPSIKILVNLLFIQGFQHPVASFCFGSQPHHHHL